MWRSLDSLAVLYRDQGKYDEAEALYERSLAIWEKALGKDHPDVATSLNNLAELYESQGKYVVAERLYPVMKALGKDHPNVAIWTVWAVLLSRASMTRLNPFSSGHWQ